MAGVRGSPDTWHDPRRFAVRFYSSRSLVLSHTGTLGAPLGRKGAGYGTPIQAQIADSVADAEMACRANEGVIL